MGVFKGMLSDKVGLAIMVVCLAPLLEEVLFRGIIQGGLIKQRRCSQESHCYLCFSIWYCTRQSLAICGRVFIKLGIGISLFQNGIYCNPYFTTCLIISSLYLMLVYADTEHSYELP